MFLTDSNMIFVFFNFRNLPDNDSVSNAKDLIEGFREELLEIETRLRGGGLGGVKDFPLWENKLKTATDQETLVHSLLYCHILSAFARTR